MTYRANVWIDGKEIDSLNRLLALDNMDDMTCGELLSVGANTYDYIPVFCADFENGASLRVDVCSGNQNYYDDIVWASPDNNSYCNFEPDYFIGDTGFEVDGDFYFVSIHRR